MPTLEIRYTLPVAPNNFKYGEPLDEVVPAKGDLYGSIYGLTVQDLKVCAREEHGATEELVFPLIRVLHDAYNIPVELPALDMDVYDAAYAGTGVANGIPLDGADALVMVYPASGRWTRNGGCSGTGPGIHYCRIWFKKPLLLQEALDDVMREFDRVLDNAIIDTIASKLKYEVSAGS